MKTIDLPVQSKVTRVLIGAVSGALIVATFVKLPTLLLNLVFGRVGASGVETGWWTSLGAGMTGIILAAFTSPWGLIGALAGVAFALREMRRESAAESETAEDAHKGLNRGEVLLGMGLVLGVLSFGIFPSVMVWMLAFFTLPPAVALVLAGIAGIGNRQSSGGKQGAGFGLLVAGFAGAAVCSVAATFLSSGIAEPRTAPSSLLPTFMILLLLLPITGMVLSYGFRLWTPWAAQRRRKWCVAVLSAPGAAFLLHFGLAKAGLLPLSA